MNYRFTLEPYKGVSTRHTCPNCHRKSCFAKYIDTEKQISFPNYVGRCNHEQKCGYNYTPKMYFDENPIAKERLSEKFVPVSKPGISLLPEPSFIEPKIMRQSLKLYHTNKLFQFLSLHFGQEAIFNRLITLNPALKTLVETFDLQLVNVEKAPLSAKVQRTRKGLFK